jgi:hypothetical protein
MLMAQLVILHQYRLLRLGLVDLSVEDTFSMLGRQELSTSKTTLTIATVLGLATLPMTATARYCHRYNASNVP